MGKAPFGTPEEKKPTRGKSSWCIRSALRGSGLYYEGVPDGDVTTVFFMGPVRGECRGQWVFGTSEIECIVNFYFLKGLPMAIEKPAKRAKEGSSSGSLGDEGSRKKYPTLIEWLEAETWADGTKRERSSIIVFVQDGEWRAGLLDKNTQQNLWVTSGDLQGLFKALETRLGDPAADWRPGRVQKGKRGG